MDNTIDLEKVEELVENIAIDFSNEQKYLEGLVEEKLNIAIDDLIQGIRASAHDFDINMNNRVEKYRTTEIDIDPQDLLQQIKYLIVTNTQMDSSARSKYLDRQFIEELHEYLLMELV